MTKTAERLFEKITALPDEEQDFFASSMLEVMGVNETIERQWDETLASPASQSWLEQASEEATKAYRDGLTKAISIGV